MGDRSLQQKYRDVSARRIEALRGELNELVNGDLPTGDPLREIHTLKGESRILGHGTVATLAAKLEELLREVVERGTELDSEGRSAIEQGLSVIETLVAGEDDPAVEMAGLDFVFRSDEWLDGREGSVEVQTERGPRTDLRASDESVRSRVASPPVRIGDRTLAIVASRVVADAEDLAAALGCRVEIELRCDSSRIGPDAATAWVEILSALLRHLVEKKAMALQDGSSEDVEPVSWLIETRTQAGSGQEVAIRGDALNAPDSKNEVWRKLQERVAAFGGRLVWGLVDHATSVIEVGLPTSPRRSSSQTNSSRGSAGPALVVDDSPITRELLASLLRARGFHVVEARHGGEARQFVERERPILILVDLEMPEVDGFQLLTWLSEKETTRCIPTIVVSSRDSIEDMQRCYDLGANAYLVKAEYREEVLMRQVEGLLEAVAGDSE